MSAIALCLSQAGLVKGLALLSQNGALQAFGKLVGKRPGEKRTMRILKGVSGALKPVRTRVTSCHTKN